VDKFIILARIRERWREVKPKLEVDALNGVLNSCPARELKAKQLGLEH